MKLYKTRELALAAAEAGQLWKMSTEETEVATDEKDVELAHLKTLITEARDALRVSYERISYYAQQHALSIDHKSCMGMTGLCDDHVALNAIDTVLKTLDTTPEETEMKSEYEWEVSCVKNEYHTHCLPPEGEGWEPFAAGPLTPGMEYDGSEYMSYCWWRRYVKKNEETK